MNSRSPHDKPDDKAADGDGLAGRQKSFSERLGRLREGRATERQGKGDRTGYGQALRLSTEFVSAILVGAGLGWGIDRFVGTAPWGMIVFLLLGFGAGIVNVLRAAGKMADTHRRAGMSDGSDDKN